MGIWHTDGGDDRGGGNGEPNELASSWTVSEDASIRLICSEQNQKHGRIPTIVGRARLHSKPSLPLVPRPNWIATSLPPALTWPCQQHGTGASMVCSVWYWLTHPHCPASRVVKSSLQLISHENIRHAKQTSIVSRTTCGKYSFSR